jgi:uncharacterized membrane protein YccC
MYFIQMRPRTVRRSIGVVLVVVGALLMWLSPETLAGAGIAGAGIALELIGIALERRT